METQHIPAYIAKDAKGDTYARVAPTQFPAKPDGDAALVHRITAYNKAALWDGVQAWFDGGKEVSGAHRPEGRRRPYLRWEGRGDLANLSPQHSRRTRRRRWPGVRSPPPSHWTNVTYGYRWAKDAVTKTDLKDGALVTLPEYYRLEKDAKDKEQWVVVSPKDVPAETGLGQGGLPEAARRRLGGHMSRPTRRTVAGRSRGRRQDRSRRNWATAAWSPITGIVSPTSPPC